LKNRKDEIQIKVENHENNQIYLWSVEKFQNKLILMRDIVQMFQESLSESVDIDSSEDPFIDQAEPLLIGQGFYKLEPLAYLIDNPATISIVGPTSTINGKLEVNIVPVDENGDTEISEELLPEHPMDLVG
jgi:hypothetical protein